MQTHHLSVCGLCWEDLFSQSPQLSNRLARQGTACAQRGQTTEETAVCSYTHVLVGPRWFQLATSECFLARFLVTVLQLTSSVRSAQVCRTKTQNLATVSTTELSGFLYSVQVTSTLSVWVKDVHGRTQKDSIFSLTPSNRLIYKDNGYRNQSPFLS